MGALRFRPAAPASAEAASPTLNADAVACHVLYDYADLRIHIKNGEAAWPAQPLFIHQETSGRSDGRGCALALPCLGVQRA